MLLTHVTTFNIQECCNCGVLFGITDTMYRKFRTGGDRFFCPNGHGQSYTETENTRLKRELEAAEKRAREQQCKAINAEAALSAKEKEFTRHKKRSAAGVCPCCKRTVSQMARHMKSEHPEYVKQQGLPK